MHEADRKAHESDDKAACHANHCRQNDDARFARTYDGAQAMRDLECD
jgi:hypothetical protein